MASSVNPDFKKFWAQKCKEVLRSHGTMTIPEKVLAYKIFLRPLLTYSWFDGNHDQLKKLEVMALKQIFGCSNERILYERYSDIDVTAYLKVQQLRWKRATISESINIKSLLKLATNDPGNPMPYFLKNIGRQNGSCSINDSGSSLRINKSPEPTTSLSFGSKMPRHNCNKRLSVNCSSSKDFTDPKSRSSLRLSASASCSCSLCMSKISSSGRFSRNCSSYSCCNCCCDSDGCTTCYSGGTTSTSPPPVLRRSRRIAKKNRKRK